MKLRISAPFYILLLILGACATSVKDNLHEKFLASKQMVAKDALFENRHFLNDLVLEDKTFILKEYEKCNDGNLDATRVLSDYLYKYKKSIHAEVFFFIGNCYFINSKYQEANHYYSLSMNLIKENEKLELKSLLNNNIGIMYYLNGYFGMGDVHLSKNLNEQAFSVAKYNMGVKHLLLGNYHQSKKIFLEIYKSNKDSDLSRRLVLASNFLLGEFDERSLKIGEKESDVLYKQFSKFYFNKYEHEKIKYDDSKNNQYEKVIFKNINNGMKIGKHEN